MLLYIHIYNFDADIFCIHIYAFSLEILKYATLSILWLFDFDDIDICYFLYISMIFFV